MSHSFHQLTFRPGVGKYLDIESWVLIYEESLWQPVQMKSRYCPGSLLSDIATPKPISESVPSDGLVFFCPVCAVLQVKGGILSLSFFTRLRLEEHFISRPNEEMLQYNILGSFGLPQCVCTKGWRAEL